VNIADLQHQIDARQEWIKSLRESSSYADSSQARLQDQRKINQLQFEIKDLKRKQRDLGGGDV
jgi:predicted  nucleic acid-binding Zn-ribbon protein